MAENMWIVPVDWTQLVGRWSFVRTCMKEDIVSTKGRECLDQMSDCNLHNFCFMVLITRIKFCFSLIYEYLPSQKKPTKQTYKNIRELPPSGSLRSEWWRFLTDVSGQQSVLSSGFFLNIEP